MQDNEIQHQQSLVTDSFSTIERLESEMAQISKEFDSLDSNQQEQGKAQPQEQASASTEENHEQTQDSQENND